MSAVSSVLGILYALGLGSLLAEMLRIGTPLPTAPSDRGELARELSTRLALGVLAHLTLVLVAPSLTIALIFGAAFAIIGAVLATVRLPRRARPSLGAFASAALAVLLTCIVAAAMLGEPLIDWDARSVWFFHAKIIFFADGLLPDAGWKEPGIAWSHPEYPKLLPVLIASYAKVIGYWNEYLPKLGLLPLTLCGTLALLAGTRPRAAFLPSLAIALGVLLGCGRLLYNGYADGYLALAAVGAIAAGMRWMRSSDPRDAVHLLAMLGIAVTTKEDGRLVLAAVAVGACGTALLRRQLVATLRAALRPRLLAAVAVTFLPFVLWAGLASRWGLGGYLKLDAETLQRGATRLIHHDTLSAILGYLWSPTSGFTVVTSALPALFAVVVLVAASARQAMRDWVPALPVLSALAYAGALTLVYMLTPFDVSWHLVTSADRTMLLPSFALFLVICDAATAIVDRRATPAPLRLEGAPPLPTGMPLPEHDLAALGLLAAVMLAAFSSVIAFDYLAFDDYFYVNEHLHACKPSHTWYNWLLALGRPLANFNICWTSLFVIEAGSLLPVKLVHIGLAVAYAATAYVYFRMCGRRVMGALLPAAACGMAPTIMVAAAHVNMGLVMSAAMLATFAAMAVVVGAARLRDRVHGTAMICYLLALVLLIGALLMYQGTAMLYWALLLVPFLDGAAKPFAVRFREAAPAVAAGVAANVLYLIWYKFLSPYYDNLAAMTPAYASGFRGAGWLVERVGHLAFDLVPRLPRRWLGPAGFGVHAAVAAVLLAALWRIQRARSPVLAPRALGLTAVLVVGCLAAANSAILLTDVKRLQIRTTLPMTVVIVVFVAAAARVLLQDARLRRPLKGALIAIFLAVLGSASGYAVYDGMVRIHAAEYGMVRDTLAKALETGSCAKTVRLRLPDLTLRQRDGAFESDADELFALTASNSHFHFAMLGHHSRQLKITVPAHSVLKSRPAPQEASGVYHPCPLDVDYYALLDKLDVEHR